MKNLLLATFLLTNLANKSFSQCTPMIFPSPGCTKITTSTTITDLSGGCYWICAGLTVDVVASAGSAFYCEQNVTININDSDGDEVYAKPGCVINNYSSADIGYTSDPSSITANNLGSGTLTITATCTPLTYDYTLVGTGSPCNTVLGISTKETSKFKVFPSLIAQGELIYIEGIDANTKSIRIVDVTGKQISTFGANTTIITSQDLVQGNYFVIIESAQGNSTHKIVVL